MIGKAGAGTIVEKPVVGLQKLAAIATPGICWVYPAAVVIPEAVVVVEESAAVQDEGPIRLERSGIGPAVVKVGSDLGESKVPKVASDMAPDPTPNGGDGNRCESLEE